MSDSTAKREVGTPQVKRGMAQMLKGGVIMDVVTPEQAKIAEDAGAVAVMALERVPADIRAQGGVARMSDPDLIEGIIEAVSIPVMAKARIGHFVEAQVLQSLGVDYIDESEVLTPADYTHHIDKWNFTVPFVCGATNLGEALRRINEGASPPRRALHGRWHRHPRRRCHDDAAGCRGRVRWFGHLQVRRPRQARGRHRQGHDLLRRSVRHRRGLPWPGRGHGRH